MGQHPLPMWACHPPGLTAGRRLALASVLPGVEFEKRILANEQNNAKFNFLNPTDPYHAYYRLRVGGGSSLMKALGHGHLIGAAGGPRARARALPPL